MKNEFHLYIWVCWCSQRIFTEILHTHRLNKVVFLCRDRTKGSKGICVKKALMVMQIVLCNFIYFKIKGLKQNIQGFLSKSLSQIGELKEVKIRCA